MGYIFSTASGGAKITNTAGTYSVVTNGPVKISISQSKIIITQEQGLGQLIAIKTQEIDSINGSPPADTEDELLDQLMAVFPDALAAAGAITSINNVIPDSGGNVALTAADIDAVATSQLSTTGGADKVVQLDGSGNLVMTGVASITGEIRANGFNTVSLEGATSGQSPKIITAGGNPNVSLELTAKGAAAIIATSPMQLNNGLNITAGNVEVIQSAAGQFAITHDQAALSGPQAAFVLKGNNNAGPAIGIGNTSQGVDGKWWDIMPVGASLNLRTVTDAGAPSVTFLSVTRSGSAITGISSNSGSGSWAHTGNLSTTGTITAGGVQLRGIVASDGKSAQSADINEPGFYAVTVSGMYRVSAFVVLSQAATTSSTLPGSNVFYTEATTGIAVQDIITQSANTNLIGLHTGGTVVIAAQQGANIGYSTSSYASSGATPMQYSIHIRVEFLG